jgi:hypothetical protein
MAKVFFPKAHILVPASSPHPPNTQYRVAIGEEIWDDKRHKVLKIQMVYNGEVAGRRSPSYPLGTDDYIRVTEAADRLYAELTNSVIEVW